MAFDKALEKQREKEIINSKIARADKDIIKAKLARKKKKKVDLQMEALNDLKKKELL